MNSEMLSKRLETVANFVPKEARLADIGSDHAYLPCYLAKKKLISFAIAGEVVEGPYLSAKSQVKAVGLENLITVRMGNGLDVIKPDEVDCITIAGMGGALIADILDRGKEKLESVSRLVLQPNISAISVRKWLAANDWELISEEILEEDGKIYEVLVAEKGDPSSPYHDNQEEGMLFGPFLLKKKQKVFRKKWMLEKENWSRIITQLEQAQESQETIAKKQDLINKIQMVEEVLSK